MDEIKNIKNRKRGGRVLQFIFAILVIGQIYLLDGNFNHYIVVILGILFLTTIQSLITEDKIKKDKLNRKISDDEIIERFLNKSKKNN